MKIRLPHSLYVLACTLLCGASACSQTSSNAIVAEAKADRILRYDIQKDGLLTNRQVFANMGSDGMTTDERGNIYLTGDGVTVFDRDGRKIAHFPVPEDWTANVCFGGKERDVLFITASKSVYTLKMLVHGAR